MGTNKKSLFVTDDGKNLMFTFILVSSLFLLWGVLNGMIDAMDKHFQDELGLTKSQSAWVQFAHYLGYFLMAMPAGWLASRLGYKIGIIAGLLMVAAGGFWFLEANNINAMAQAGSIPITAAFIANLAGVCAIAAGLTFLETVANPYTTVLGPQRYAATRINLAQSCNGVGWICGPILGSVFFYSTDAAGRSTGSETLYIPYVAIAGVALVLSAIFYFAYIPDIKTEDDYHLDDSTRSVSHSIWTHPHFVLAVLAQFLYVAAQAGIFSFFINYMTSEVPAIPALCRTDFTKKWIEVKTTFANDEIKNLGALADKLKQEKPDAVSTFVRGKLSDSTVAALNKYNDYTSDSRSLRSTLVQELNSIIKQDPNKVKKDKPAKDQLLYDAERFSGVHLGQKTREVLAQKLKEDKEAAAKQAALEKMTANERIIAAKEKQPEEEKVNTHLLNRLLLQDAYPGELLAFDDSILTVSDKGASLLLSIGFICFLIGRFTGAGLLKKFSAHKTLGLYGLMNVAACLLIFAKWGWFSVACVFLSFFFMSIMFPTIFALGIFGLGARAKKASAFIVMAIMGGAILPKLMGYVADQYDMSRGFIVPMVCFAFVAFYGFCWPKFSHADSLHGAPNAGRH